MVYLKEIHVTGVKCMPGKMRANKSQLLLVLVLLTEKVAQTYFWLLKDGHLFLV